MSVLVRLNFLMVCACCIFGVGPGQLFAAGTNFADLSPRQAGDKTAQDTLNAFLQIQEQLHTTQLVIESNRVVATAEAQRNAAEMAARIQVLEQTVASQRASEIEATQKAQRLTLILAGVFGVVSLAAVLFMAYFQWRAVTRLVELSPLHPSARELEGRGASPMLSAGEAQAGPGRAAVEFSNARLFNVVERLEQRLLELEHMARAPLAGSASPPVDGHNGAPAISAGQGRSIANLLAEGQSLLNDNRAGKSPGLFRPGLVTRPEKCRGADQAGGGIGKAEPV